MSLASKTIEELHFLYKKGEVSVTEVVKDSLQRIKDTNHTLNSFSFINEKQVLADALILDKEGMPDDHSKLWGIPLSIKENMCVEGLPATCGSKILGNFVSPYDGAMGGKLKAAKALLIGICRMDEFAMGSSCETNAFGMVKNPYDLDRVPGGSSGGNAVSVASNQVVTALGSDTGGSIRQPASLSGVVGMKPTYGLISRFGLVSYASSLDQIGPFARTVKDAACTLSVIAGHDNRDSTSYKHNIPDYTALLEQDIKGLKIGLPVEYYAQGISPNVLKNIEEAKKTFLNLGAELVEISLPHTSYATPAYYILATAEASANLARFDGVRYGRRAKEYSDLKDLYIKSRSEGFGLEVQRRIIIGTFVLSSGYYDAYYLKAQKVRTFIKQDFDNAFKDVDVIMTPTSPFTAFNIGEKMDDPISMYLSDIYTVSVNLAGLPAISLPIGADDNNLPVGMQLIGKSLKEEKLLNIAHQFELAANFSSSTLKV